MDSTDIDLFALRSLCVLIDERGVSRAASRLGVGQSRMSRQLAQLRTYFADPLLVWVGGTMVPTPRALALRDDVGEVVRTMERLSSPPRTFDPVSSETMLVLVATGYTEHFFLADAISTMTTRLPKVRVEIRLPDVQQDVNAMGRGEIDFLIGWMTTPPPSLRSRLLFEDKLVCIARAAHPRLRDDNLTYEKYVELPHVQYEIPGKTTTERLLHERLSRNGDHQNIRYYVENALTVAHVVANSGAIATVPNRFARRCATQYELKIFDLPLSLPSMQDRIYWHECMHSDDRSRWFRRLLVDLAKTS
jgi:DNA-binding transcriptional LysR family regulator